MSELDAILAELRALRAAVTTGPVSSARDVAEAEAALGFSLPEEYVDFVKTVGGIAITLERTWFFYGLDDARAKRSEYADTFEEARSWGTEAYYPKRFLVFGDEGDFSNQAAGTVYDADLDALLVTDGARYVHKDDAFEVGHGGWLLDELEAVRDRIADSDDVLVAGGVRDLTKRQQERDAIPESPERALRAARLREAVEALYATFGAYAGGKRWACFFDGCGDCVKSNDALARTELRALQAHDLAHYAYMALADSARAPSSKRARAELYKHFLPRILEIVDDISTTGNPTVMLPAIVKSVWDITEGAERAALEEWAAHHWAWLLEHPATNRDLADAWLRAFAKTHASLDPFLATWRSCARAGSSARTLRAQWVEYVDPANGPSYYGWSQLAGHFDELTAFLREKAAR